MDSWILLALLILLWLFLNKIIGAIPVSSSCKISLPPGPPSIPIIGSTLWFTHCLLNFQTILHRLFAEYGPVVAVRLPFSGRPSIYISDRSLAHQVFVQRGSALANRFLSSTFVLRHAIGGTPYGPRYRILRRNLASSVMQPSKLASFGAARELALHDLIRRLSDRTNAGGAVRVRDCLCNAVNRLHILMCFGEKLDDKLMDEVEQLQNELIRSIMSIESGSFRAVASKFLRGLTRTKLNKHEELQKKLEEILIPVMTERRERVERGECSLLLHSYVDSLQQLEVPDEDGSARRLTEEEKLYFCCEFLMGTDSTITELEWIMANIIKNQDIQAKLWQEIEGMMAEEKAEREILKEEEVEKMPYLKAVIFEGLRRHPPNLALIPRVAEEDIVLGDRYLIPKGSFVSVSIAEIGRGEQAWDEPMQFRPERFLDSKGGGVVEHLMGSGKEARMFPFGLGGRVCPAAGMAELNLKFLVANLVRVFEWKANCEDGRGEDIDLSEEMMATAVMRVPLRARIISRISGV